MSEREYPNNKTILNMWRYQTVPWVSQARCGWYQYKTAQSETGYSFSSVLAASTSLYCDMSHSCYLPH